MHALRRPPGDKSRGLQLRDGSGAFRIRPSSSVPTNDDGAWHPGPSSHTHISWAHACQTPR